MDRTWMYRARRTDAYFHGEHNKFIQAGKNHERNKKTHGYLAPANLARVRECSTTQLQ